jgi:hypothetical protein
LRRMLRRAAEGADVGELAFGGVTSVGPVPPETKEDVARTLPLSLGAFDHVAVFLSGALAAAVAGVEADEAYTWLGIGVL